MSKASVIMIAWSPNEHRMRVMQKTLKSLRKNTQKPYELIVVDNGPKEQTRLIAKYTPDKHIINPVNRNVGPSRNQGAAEATGDYLAFVDNDIIYFPNWLNRCIEALEQYPKRKLVATAVKTHPMKQAFNWYRELGEYQLYWRCAGMAMVMSRGAYEEVGPFEELRTNVGHQWCLRMRAKKYVFIHHPTWTGRHVGQTSYHYKHQQWNAETGTWTDKESK